MKTIQQTHRTRKKTLTTYNLLLFINIYFFRSTQHTTTRTHTHARALARTATHAFLSLKTGKSPGVNNIISL